MNGPCEADTCHNGGSCYSNDYPSSWWCNCPPGRSGMFCEIEMPGMYILCHSSEKERCLTVTQVLAEGGVLLINIGL